jgi:hypothetical protein
MDKYQVRSCLSASGSITYDPLTGVIGGGGGGGATWGSITGTLSSQTDLQTALDAKQNESIVINSNTTAVLDGVYTVVASATFTDPTPAEGKGFMVFVRNGTATVGGTGYSTAGTVINRIFHSGAWANYTLAPTSLAIGTTPITGGTVGRVLFEGTGNVLQQASNIFWDNANSRLSLGIGASPAARLDILAPGTGTTDLTMRVRNTGNTTTLLEYRGDGDMLWKSNAFGYNANLHFYKIAGNNSFSLTNGTSWSNGTGIKVDGSNFVTMVSNSLDTVQFLASTFFGTPPLWINLISGTTTTRKNLLGWNGNFPFLFENTNFGIGMYTLSSVEFGTSATNTFGIKNGTAPTTGIAGGNGFQMYSADIVAGNAAPHFRTENNDIVKIYSIGGWGTPTGTLTRTTFATYAGATAGVLYDQTIMQNLIDAEKITSERLAALISDLKTGQQLLKT